MYPFAFSVRFFCMMILVTLVGCADSSSSKDALNDVEQQATIYVTGIPDENPSRIAQRSALLVKRLEKALGRTVKYVPVTDYAAAVAGLRSGKVDFAWLGGFTFVQAKRLANAQSLVMRDVDRTFQSVFIASAKSGITTTADLKGKRFAFGSKSSTSGHLMPRYFLEGQLKLDVERDFKGAPLFTGTHDATAVAVSSGRVDVGALNLLVYERLLREKKLDASTVVEIGRTPPFVDYVWASRKDVDPKLQEKFVQLFLSLDVNKPEDATLLQLQNAKRYVRAQSHDFDDIEKIALSIGLLQ